ncbi:hypothetical protein AZF37_05085 [endosymbiont 'TC1' of Trimyema compressum]|uniref:cytidine deaminase n=1 Tax=endosymbiont 'TC1' of Trimyema compressum TaxID=243899 RepID=UPI0007F1502E|nr:cytidine deaminase [endosymbiont 'TC1' of Trimyema compressum]AMP20633.1 hypothetical protein AZF37_05085 [endosymbiont 'TC1' of Trimyema compressum]
MSNREVLKAAAYSVLENAYSTYSSIKVAAAVMDRNGSIFKSINVENAGYSPTICGERNAIFTGITEGCKDFTEMVVVTDSSLVKSPCGTCRQVLSELAPELKIYFYGPNNYYHEFTIEELLPVAFTLKEEK